MLRAFCQGRRLDLVLLAAAICVGLAFPVSLVIRAWLAGVAGFPLDDAWIHLTYARNLWLHHALSYFPGDPPTLGTTSPLFSMVLSLGFALTDNEKLLAQVASLVFQLGFLFAWRCKESSARTRAPRSSFAGRSPSTQRARGPGPCWGW